MLSLVRRLFVKRGPVSAAVYQGWDQVPSATHCTVRAVITLEEEYANDIVFLTRTKFRVDALTDGDIPARTPAAQQLKQFIKDASPGYYGRVAIPEDLSEGIATEYAEIAVPYACIPPDSCMFDINQGMLPCVAEAGQKGAIEVQPYFWEAIDHRQQERIAWVRARSGVVMHPFRVMVNRGIYEPGREDLPGLVLLTFDRDTARDRRYLTDLATRLYDLNSRDATNPAEKEAQAIVMANMSKAVYHRRALLPRAFTGGPLVYAADLWYHRPYLQGGILQSTGDRTIRCMVEPGAQGGIEHMPAKEK